MFRKYLYGILLILLSLAVYGFECVEDKDCDGTVGNYKLYCTGVSMTFGIDDYTCFPQLCTDDSHCRLGWCDTSWKDKSGSYQCHRYVECTSDSNCQHKKDHCRNGYCIPKDDCDFSTLCKTDCTNSDPKKDGEKGNQDSDIPDCRDICTDKDGDHYCDETYSTRIVDSDLWKNFDSATQSVLESAGWSSEDLDDSAYNSEVKLAVGAGILALASGNVPNVFALDCDDNNANVNPGTSEVECNLIDDDCDGVVDECSDTGSGTSSEMPMIASSDFQSSGVPDSAKALESVLAGGLLEQSSSVPKPVSRDKVECVYTTKYQGCQHWDADGDGYLNASFGCPDCNDCNDNDSSVHPGADDSGSDKVDENCNGITGEGADKDGEGIPDDWDVCDTEGSVNPINASGCWHSTVNNNLDGWSIG